MTASIEKIREKAEVAPERPGVYIYRDARGKPLYVGKAKSLRQRVRSYFHDSAAHTPKTLQMLSEARDLEIILAGSEIEALILENNLIKREQPRFNVLLRDDKNYPYLKVTVEDDFPRVTLVRQARRDGSEYFGPYLPASSARRSLRMLSKYFQVAICHERLDGSRPRPCLYYQLNQCLGPCAGLVTRERYRQAVDDARLFLQGRDRDLLGSLRDKMRRASEAQEYEQAAHYRDLMRVLERAGRRQTVASVGLEQQDYFHYHREQAQAVLELFMMRDGLIQARREFSFEGAEEDDFLGAALAQYYTGDTFVPQEIYVPHDFSERALLERWLSERRGERVAIKMPRRGVKARFLETVGQNADLAFETRFRSAHAHGVQGLDELREALGLDEAPYRIEAFDISNLQGTDQVASMVVWDGGRPRPSEYRRFRIRSVQGSDDFRCLAEAVQRRYARRLERGGALPDLVLIDGGKGQLGAASAVLREIGLHELQVVAIAKREELLYLEGRQGEIRLPESSPALQILQRVRDEAHRFAVSYHRTLRRKRTVRSELEEVPGLGPKRRRELLKRFGSLERVLRASEAELREILGPTQTARLCVWRRDRAAAGAAEEGEGAPMVKTPHATDEERERSGQG
jgi:excinuclease ABC subunit C